MSEKKKKVAGETKGRGGKSTRKMARRRSPEQEPCPKRIVVVGAGDPRSTGGRLVRYLAKTCGNGNASKPSVTIVAAYGRSWDPDVAKGLKKYGARIVPVALDLSKPRKMAAAAGELRKAAGGKIDLFLMVAGLSPTCAFGQGNSDDAMRVMKINAISPRLLIENIAGHMKKKTGRIIVEGSNHEDNVSTDHPDYRASKAALFYYCQAMCLSIYSLFEVPLVYVAPGWVWCGRHADGGIDRSAEERQLPVGKMLEPEQIGHYFLYLYRAEYARAFIGHRVWMEGAAGIPFPQAVEKAD